MRSKCRLLCVVMFCLGGTAAVSQAPDTSHLRDQRYCEVLLGSGGLIVPKKLAVYNTIGLNTCPEDLWSRITVDSVKKETGAKFVKLNGPRHWVVDNFVNSRLQNQTIRNFGGISMREAGILDVHLNMLSAASTSSPASPSISSSTRTGQSISCSPTASRRNHSPSIRYPSFAVSCTCRKVGGTATSLSSMTSS